MNNNFKYHIMYKGKIFFTMFSNTPSCIKSMLANIMMLKEKDLGVYHIIKNSDKDNFDESLIIVTES